MKIRFTFILFCIASQVFAQGSYIPLGSTSQHLLDRFEIKSGRLAVPEEFNTSSKAFQRNRIASYIDSFNTSSIALSKADYFNLDYLQNDNFEFSNSETTLSRKKVWKDIYKYKAAFYGVKDKDFNIVINPVVYMQVGWDTRLNHYTMIDNRGAEIRGSIGKSIGFFTTLQDENQTLNSWTKDFYLSNQAVPGVGFLKAPTNTKELSFNYNLASGYLVVQPNKFIDLQIGHGRNFLGNGYRSLFISDFSRDHFFVRVNTRFWKINYTNIWGQISDWIVPGQKRLPKRHYYALTYANVNVSKKLNIGLFQNVVFQRDSGYANAGYEIEYLNPIIFYKPIENGLNSPDKVMIGVDFKWNFAKHFQLYGQGLLNEFIFHEVFTQSGSFANKWAGQLGFKYVDVFNVSNFDVQGEFNFARPYMYTSFNRLNAYVNYNQNMAHPLGANFYEWIGIARFQPKERLFLKTTAIIAIYGNDTAGSNWGKDIRLNYYTYVKEYRNTIAQGVRTNLYMVDVLASYMIRHNIFIDCQIGFRKTKSALPALFDTQAFYGSVGVRWNINERRYDF